MPQLFESNPYPRPSPGEAPSLPHVLYWVFEREMIRQLKVAGETENLTRDPILQAYRFCNVRRRDDRVSRWIIENMLIHADPTDDDIWFIAAIARYINWPPMLATLLAEGLIPRVVDEFDYKRFGECVDDVTRSGGKAWGAAYMTFPCKVIKGQSKGAATAEHILTPLVVRAWSIRDAVTSNSVEKTMKSILGSYGFSEFMAMQVTMDITYTEQLGGASDLYTFAARGPGSQRGLNRLLDRNLSARWGECEFIDQLRSVKSEIERELRIPPLVLADVQSVFCEMDKYWRVLYGEGKPRAMYHPETAY